MSSRLVPFVASSFHSCSRSKAANHAPAWSPATSYTITLAFPLARVFALYHTKHADRLKAFTRLCRFASLGCFSEECGNFREGVSAYWFPTRTNDNWPKILFGVNGGK